MSDRLKATKFETGAGEADWWFYNEDVVAEGFDAAVNSGTLRRSTLADRLARAETLQFQ